MSRVELILKASRILTPSLFGGHVEIIGLPSGCGDARSRPRRVTRQKPLVDHRTNDGVVVRVRTGVVDWAAARPLPRVGTNDQANPVNDAHALRGHGNWLIGSTCSVDWVYREYLTNSWTLWTSEMLFGCIELGWRDE